MDMNEVLGKLFDGTVLKLNDGTEVVIKKTNLKTLKPTVALIKNIFASLPLGAEGIPQLDGDVIAAMSNSRSFPELLLKLISEFYDDVVAVLAIHTNLSVEQIVEYDIDQTVLIAIAVWEVNKDFFTTRVQPLMKSLGVAVPEVEQVVETPTKK